MGSCARLAPIAAALGVSLVAPAASAQCGQAAGDMSQQLTSSERCARPRRPGAAPALRVGLEGTFGALLARDGDATIGLSVPVDAIFGDVLGLGARASLDVPASDGLEGVGHGAHGAGASSARLSLLLGPRLLVATEPSRREAFRFEASAGWMAHGGGYPVLEVAAGRQGGILVVDSHEDVRATGYEVALLLRAQQGLGEGAAYRALLLSAGVALELSVPAPEGARPRRTRPAVEHTFGMDLDVAMAFHPEDGSVALGGGLFVGLPLGRLLEPRVRLEAFRVGGPQDGAGSTLVAGLAGLHLGRWFPFFLEVLGGVAQPLGSPLGPYDRTGVVELRAGLQIADAFGCGFGLTVANQLRVGTSRRDDVDGGLFTVGASVGIGYDSLIRAAECWP